MFAYATYCCREAGKLQNVTLKFFNYIGAISLTACRRALIPVIVLLDPPNTSSYASISAALLKSITCASLQVRTLKVSDERDATTYCARERSYAFSVWNCKVWTAMARNLA